MYKAKKSLGLNQSKIDRPKFHKRYVGLKNFSGEKVSLDAFRAKKHLGQNFLKSVPALHAMCSSGEIKEGDMVLEIGPGKGALTAKLLERGANVLAVEKDNELYAYLQEKFDEEIKSGKLKLINEDILNLKTKDFSLEKNKYKIIANIPYNITGAIFKKFLSEEAQPERMILLVQKEVAERVVARDKKESILSLSVKAYGTPKYVMKVEKRFFSPSPKVDSAIIAITSISRKNFTTSAEEKLFFDVVRAGFAHKRKILRKNLEILGIGNEKLDKIFQKLKISPLARAEDLDFTIWSGLTRNLSTDK